MLMIQVVQNLTGSAYLKLMAKNMSWIMVATINLESYLMINIALTETHICMKKLGKNSNDPSIYSEVRYSGFLTCNSKIRCFVLLVNT